MAYFEFPHTRTYDTDLGWLIHAFKDISAKLDQYLENAVITFADPITWDITEQYTALTCVIDSDGTAYLSKQPVPAGVDISNTNYWLPIFNYDDNINTLRDQIAYNARTSATTGAALQTGDLVFWNGLLYEVIVDMPAGTAFIVDTNIKKYTVDEKFKEFMGAVDDLRNDVEVEINDLESQIAINEGDSATATQTIPENALVFLNHLLYQATTDIAPGTAFIPGTNVNRITVDDKFSSTIISSLEYVTPQMYGAAADGVTEDSQAIQEALDSGKPVVFPTGTYVCRNAYRKADTILLGCNGAVLKPFYINGVAQNVITIEDASKFYMENITIRGEFFGTYDMGVMRNSAVELINLDEAVITNCVFDTIDDSYVQWEQKFRDRKALAITAHDVSYVRIEKCNFNNLGSDEINWITNRNRKSMQDIHVEIMDCWATNSTRLSLFDVIAGTINIDRLICDSSNDFQTYSIMNLFADTITVKNSEFYCNCGDAIDTYEGGTYFPDMVIVDNCVFNGYTGRAITTAARNVNISNCQDTGRGLMVLDNQIATLPDIIANMDGTAYTTYIPVELIRVENCVHYGATPDPSYNSFHVFLARVGGPIIYSGNYVDQAGLKGNALWMMDVTDAKIENNIFKNAGYSAGSSSNRAFTEVNSGTKRISYVGNESDLYTIGLILTTGVEYVRIYGNTMLSGTNAIVSNLGTATYKTTNLVSDTTRITLNADNYTGYKGDMISGDWIAASSSASGTQLTDKLTLPPGLYIVNVELPYAGGDLLGELWNYTINGGYGYTNIRVYGTATYFVSIFQTCEIAMRSAGSNSVTLSNYSGRKINAIPIKIG